MLTSTMPFFASFSRCSSLHWWRPRRIRHRRSTPARGPSRWRIRRCPHVEVQASSLTAGPFARVACVHPGANFAACFVPSHLAAGCGARHRRSPTGGAAKGMPRYTVKPSSDVPWTRPPSLPSRVPGPARNRARPPTSSAQEWFSSHQFSVGVLSIRSITSVVNGSLRGSNRSPAARNASTISRSDAGEITASNSGLAPRFCQLARDPTSSMSCFGRDRALRFRSG